MNGKYLPGAWGCGWEEGGGNTPRTTPEGLESPALHTGHGICLPAPTGSCTHSQFLSS